MLFYAIISILFILYLLFAFSSFDRSVGQTKFTLFTIGLFLLIYIPKILVTLILVTEDVFRVFEGAVNYIVDESPLHDSFFSKR
jgi:membrane glycosyltransferase